MAKTVKQEKTLEASLWESANKLRGSVEPSEYKHVVLSLIFLKYASDKFEERRQEIIDEGHSNFVDNVAFYTMKNVFYLPVESRWTYIMSQSKQSDIALKIDSALHSIEANNETLVGALPDNYYSRLGLDTSKLASLLDEINKIELTRDKEQDVMGRVYEYFLSNFALQEGKGKGEFYTPKCIVNLIAELIEPYKGTIYDPCCGSGGMFVQSLKFVQSHHGSTRDISVFGQEAISTTMKMAKMNLAIRGISADLGKKAVSTFTDDQHKDKKFDFIMANPPFNQKAWRVDNELVEDSRWDGYKTPPTSNANYGWILHMVSHLSQNGVAGFLLANGALSGEGIELEIRKQLIDNDLIEAIVILPSKLFYTTDISVTLWIINKNKKARTITQNGVVRKYRDRSGEILFVDLRTSGSAFEKKFVELTDSDREKVAKVYHTWQSVDSDEQYKNLDEYCFSAVVDDIEMEGEIIQGIRSNNYSLVPSKYIKFVNRDENIDYDEKMMQLQSELTELLIQEKQSREELLNVFKELGYEIKL